MYTATPILPTWQRRPVQASTRTTGFTLVELLVVMVILSILGSLSLAGLNVGRQRSKADKTRSTITKINSVIEEMHDSYRTRLKGTTKAQLGQLRATIVEEMPDSWANVVATATTGPGKAYHRYRTATSPDSNYQGAECLYMIVTRSGFAPDVIEVFRPDEIGDKDDDGAKEFHDGWGNPIAFMRWAPGFSSSPSGQPHYSSIQIADPTRYHDPFDLGTPPGYDPTAFELVPVIYSPGPDDATSASSGYGLLTSGTAGWPMASSQLEAGICQRSDSTGKGLIGAPDPDNPNAYKDNITNHDIMVR